MLSYLNPFSYFKGEIKKLEEELKTCPTWERWKAIANRLDELKGNQSWKEDPKSDLYDYRLIEERLRSLQKEMQSKNVVGLMRLLRSDLSRNLGGMGNGELYSRVHFGTKKLIENYVEEVVSAIKYLKKDETCPLLEKFDFFWATRQSFGRSALLLSGGASLGVYHLGVIKALVDHNLMPRVISGSSVGSIIATLVATRTDDELPDLFAVKNINLDAFDPAGSTIRKIKRLFSQGVLMDGNILVGLIKANLGDYPNMTFREAFEKTGRILNITVAPTNSFEVPRLLNYLTSPDVVIWSASLASCALAGLYKPVQLMYKNSDGQVLEYHPANLKWTDGSVVNDLPMMRLSELFNINHFLVSQVNPHVAPFMSSTNVPPSNTLWNYTKSFLVSEMRHRVTQASNIGLVPKSFDFFLGVMSQTYSGDITIVPELTVEDYGFLLANPTHDWIKKCIFRNERNTWALMAMIKQHCAIELELDRVVQELRKTLNHPQHVSNSY